MAKEKRRKFAPEFKAKIVRLKLFKNMTTKKICERYFIYTVKTCKIHTFKFSVKIRSKI